MNAGKFECPLCHSQLSETRFLEVLGVWQAQERFKSSLKKKLEEVEKAKREAIALKVRMKTEHQKRLEVERRKRDQLIARLTQKMDARIRAAERRGAHQEAVAMRRNFRKEISEVKRKAVKSGESKIKKANERVLKTVRMKDVKIENLNREVKELHEQIRKGTMQQIEGLNFEKMLSAELRKRFAPRDLIQPYGKGGDILHTVRETGKNVGAILYECKKSSNWSNNFLKQVKKDMESRGANYGVVVTFALPKSQRGFMVRADVCFVHPYGALYLADTLRTALVEAHKAKMSPGKIEQRLRDLMEYIQGNRFKGAIRQIIGEAEELVGAMGKEMQDHWRFWRERYSRYGGIYHAASRVKMETTGILKGEGGGHIERPAVAGFLPMPELERQE